MSNAGVEVMESNLRWEREHSRDHIVIWIFFKNYKRKQTNNFAYQGNIILKIISI